MRVMVIGGKGSIGSRYVAILKYLGHEPIVYDVQGFAIKDTLDTIDWSGMPTEWDKAIIATPTDTHYAYCKKMIEIGKSFLCEKPLSFSHKECKELVDLDTKRMGRMVFNYSYLYKDILSKIRYNYFRTGSDGLLWDCCQLVTLDWEAKIMNDSPVWSLVINGQEVPYSDLEKTYIYMIQDFINDEYKYGLGVGQEMTYVVSKRLGLEVCAA